MIYSILSESELKIERSSTLSKKKGDIIQGATLRISSPLLQYLLTILDVSD